MTPIYVPGEDYAFYINFTKPISDPDFANFRLRLYKGTVLIEDDLGELLQDVVQAGTGGVNLYNIYCSFAFPDVKNGQYQFVIYDVVNDVEKCRSNVILCERDEYDRITSTVIFRHDENKFNYYFENLPNFFLKYRVPIVKIETQFESDKEVYRSASNSRFRNINSYLDKVRTLESYYFDDDAHEAAATVYDMRYIFINNIRIVTKSGYTIQNNQLSTVTKATIEVYEYTTETFDKFFIPNGFDLIINTGDAIFNPDLIYDGN